MLFVLVALSTLCRPRPTDGPTLPLRFLRGLELRRTSVQRRWTRGVYGVTFVYVSPKPIAALAAMYRKEVAGASPIPRTPFGTYSHRRLVGSTWQDCSIGVNGI